MKILKLSVTICLFTLLTACGGGGNTNDPATDISPITSNSDGVFSARTGVVTYEIEDSFSSPQFSYTSTGTEVLTFKDFGNTRKIEEESYTIFGDGTVSDSRDLKLEVGSIVYSVDYENQEIDVNDFTELVDILSDTNNPFGLIGSAVKDGFKVINFSTCTNYILLNGTVCYNAEGILVEEVLRTLGSTESNSPFNYRKVATDVTYNQTFLTDEFDLPDYPIND